jgi:hypothetical protein
MPSITPSMPHVDADIDVRPVFAHARQVSAGTVAVPAGPIGGRAAAIITPGRLIMPVLCPPASAVSPQMLEDVRLMVPEHPKQQITVIANNNVVATGAFTAREANGLIPILGYLLGMAFDGHTVVVFEGHPSALAAGCEGSTMLFVDKAMVEYLQPDWPAVAASTMSRANIRIFGRDGSMARIVPAGESAQSPAASQSNPKKRWWWPFGGGT